MNRGSVVPLLLASTYPPAIAGEPSAPVSSVKYVRNGFPTARPHPPAAKAIRWKSVFVPSPNSVEELVNRVLPATVTPEPGPPMSAVQSGLQVTEPHPAAGNASNRPVNRSGVD